MNTLLVNRNLFAMIIIFAFCQNVIYGQNTTEKQLSDDTFRELDKGALSLRFYDALSGAPIDAGKVVIENVPESKTDFNGIALFKAPEENAQLKVQFSHPKYITTSFTIEIMAGSLFINRFSISPKMPVGSLRIVLDWGDNPRDLDAHFVKEGDYHISYRNMKVSNDGIARLDRDATNGNGPETITISALQRASAYLFYVHDFTNQGIRESSGLSDSRAVVKVYSDNALAGVYEIPPQATGTYWEVFRIKNGLIEQVNTLTEYAP